MVSRFQYSLAGLAVSLVSLACADLPVVDTGVCGNGIVEANEDCDTYAPPGNVCRPPSATANPCRYDCSAQSGGAEACPKDARCGVDHICHFSSPNPTYAAFGEPLAIPAQSLRLGDFDGDGKQDLLALGNSNNLWQSFPIVLFFDGAGKPQDVFDPRIPVSSPSILTLNQSDTPPDPRQQFVAGTSYGISALEVTPVERSVLPIAYPIQQLPQGWQYRMVRVRGTGETSVHEAVLIFMSLSTPNNSMNGQIIVANSGFQVGSMPNPVSQLAGEPIAANVISGTDSPCEEALLAYTGDSHLYMLSPCDSSGQWVHSTLAPTPVASLTSPTGNPAIGQTPIAARVDTDEYLDLLLADDAGNPYVAFGNGDGTFVADPGNPISTLGQAWPVSITQGNCLDSTAVDTQFPLAVGDLNRDGISDWVMPHGVHLIQSVTVDSTTQRVVIRACVSNGPFIGTWSTAKIADLNRDGLQDVIAGSIGAPDLTFLEGTGLDVLNPFGILSGGPLSQVVIGDFDGDLISDVAFSVQTGATAGASTSTTEKLSIAFGNSSGAPGTPVEIGQIATIEQMQTAKYSGVDSIDEIGVFAQSGDNSGQQLSIFIGSTGRHPIAPLGLAYAQGSDLIDAIPLATAVGNIGTDTNPGALSVAMNCQSTCEYRVWLVPGVAHGKFGPPIPSPKLPVEFAPDPTGSDPMNAANVSYYVLLGDVDRDKDHAVEAFILSEGTDGATINLWGVNVPATGSNWTDQTAAVQLLSTTPGKLSVTSSPTLVDLDQDGALDLVMVTQQLAPDGHYKQTLAVVWNQANSLDLSGIISVELNGQEARAFSTVSDRGATRLVATTDEATYEIRGIGRGLLASPIPDVPGGDSIALGDMTGDGLLDLAIGASVPNQVQLYQETPQQP